MRFVGEETVQFPMFEEKPPIKRRIDTWLQTAVGIHYEVKKWEPDQIILEKRWNDSDFMTYCLLGWWAAFYQEKIRITIDINDSDVSLMIESTRKQEAELDFDSLINAIKGS